MIKMGLQARKTRKKQRTTDSEQGFPRFPNLVLSLEVARPDEVRVADLTHVRLQQELGYLTIIMDVFTRCIRSWNLERHLGQELTLTALRCALLDHVPEIHHSDQEVQYAATAYVDLLHDYGIAISMTDRGQAWQNGYAERIIRTIKEEEVELSDYQDYHDAYDQIGRFLDNVCRHKRIHSSLGYLTVHSDEFVHEFRTCRPLIPEHADHLFRQHVDHFSGTYRNRMTGTRKPTRMAARAHANGAGPAILAGLLEIDSRRAR